MRYLALVVIMLLIACQTKNPDRAPTLKPDDTPDAKIIPLPPDLPPPEIVTPSYPPLIGGQGSNGGHRTPPKNLCGNNRIDGNEICDDGNKSNNDGCTTVCQAERGFPLCSWTCDDPVCDAQCEPFCDPADCSVRCEQPPPQDNCICESTCGPIACEVQCPEDLCETEHCPACQNICSPPLCRTECRKIAPTGPDCSPSKPECEIACEPTKCAWQCMLPNCPKPQCELNCEQLPPNC